MAYSDIDSDINFLKYKIEEIHPNPYWNLPAEQFDSLLNAVKSNTHGKRKINQKRLFQLLNPVLAQLDDGHTRMEVPFAIKFRAFFWGSRILPLAFRVKDEELFLKANLKTKDLFDENYQVLSINGLPIQELIDQLMVNKYGYSREFRLSQIDEVSLTRDLWMYLDLNKRFDVEVLTPEGKTELMIFKGMHQPRYYRRLHEIAQNELLISDEPYGIVSEYGFYREVDDQVAIIRYNKFKGDSKSYIDSVFNMAKTSDIKHLIFDLRGNPGGSSNIYKTILSHLTNDSIMIFSNVEYRVSQDLINNKIFGSYYPYPNIDALGEVRSLEANLMMVVPNSEVGKFQGQFYVLMDRGTFSAATGFCALIQDNNLGILIGESSGGLGSDFGAPIRVKLPKSKIPLLISSARLYRTNGDVNFVPVIPDIQLDSFGRDQDDIYMKINELFLMDGSLKMGI